MYTNKYQEFFMAIQRWFEKVSLPTEPVPIPVKVQIDKVQIDEA